MLPSVAPHSREYTLDTSPTQLGWLEPVPEPERYNRAALYERLERRRNSSTCSGSGICLKNGSRRARAFGTAQGRNRPRRGSPDAGSARHLRPAQLGRALQLTRAGRTIGTTATVF